MATLETQQIDAVISSTRRKMFALGGTALAGLALAGIRSADAQSASIDTTDLGILNFALSLEFLGANYYSLGLNGVTIANASPAIPTGTGGKGTGGSVTVKANPQVNFQSSLIKNFVTQLLADEIGHVTALQSVLGSNAVAMADIDLMNSFNALAVAAGIGTSFDPFSGGDANFLLGAFIFEDNDTSAYHGSAPLIQDKVNVLPAAVAIHAVEAQHAGLVRSTLLQLDIASSTPGAISLQTQKIAALRQQLSTVADVGVSTQSVSLEGGSYTALTLVDADPTMSQAPGRTANQILNVVTGGNTGGAQNGANYTGGFFPQGINGTIR